MSSQSTIESLKLTLFDDIAVESVQDGSCLDEIPFVSPQVELGQEVEAHVELEDSRQELLPASALDLVQLRPLLASPILDLRWGTFEKADWLTQDLNSKTSLVCTLFNLIS